MDRKGVHRVTKSQTWLRDWTATSTQNKKFKVWGEKNTQLQTSRAQADIQVQDVQRCVRTWGYIGESQPIGVFKPWNSWDHRQSKWVAKINVPKSQSSSILKIRRKWWRQTREKKRKEICETIVYEEKLNFSLDRISGGKWVQDGRHSEVRQILKSIWVSCKQRSKCWIREDTRWGQSLAREGLGVCGDRRRHYFDLI